MHQEPSPTNGVVKAPSRHLDTSGLEEAYYRLYREFFDRAEKKRRWSIQDDIPWDRCKPATDPAIADVVESFCGGTLPAGLHYQDHAPGPPEPRPGLVPCQLGV